MFCFRKTLFAFAIVASTASIACRSTAFGDGIERELLADLRESTVLIKVGGNGNESSGSGFLIRKEGSLGYVLTNEHVIGNRRNADVAVVLHSGFPSERSLVGRVIATSESADLALIRIKSNELPKPIRVGKSTTATETTQTYLFGFPFGSDLESSRSHPAITVSPVTVSSLRRTSDGEIDTVQLDGNLNPGNSGGPVVDRKGQLVGVAVATIRNAGIGFAIPVEKVRGFLKGDIRNVTMATTATTGDYKVEAMLTDPFNQIRVIRGEYSIDRGDPMPFLCKRESHSATARIQVQGDSASIRLTLVAELRDGSIIKKAPLEIPIRDGRIGRASMVKSNPMETGKTSPNQQELANQAKPVSIDFGGKVIAISPSPDGTGAFVIREGNQGNELVFWNATKNTTSERIQVPKSPRHVAIFNNDILVSCPESKVVAVLDPATKKITNAAPLTGSNKPFRICKTAGTDLAYVLATPNGSEPDRDASVIQINLKTRKSKEIRQGDIERATVQGTQLACQENFGGSPSGIPKVLDVANANQSGTRRGFPHSSFGRIHPSNHGLFVATHSGNTIGFEPQDNLNTIVWSQEGILVGAWPDQSRFLITKGEDLTNPEAMPLVAVSRSGSILWKADIPFPEPVSMFLTKNLFLFDRHKKLLVGTANHGSVFSVAQRIVGTAMSQAYVVGTGVDDRLLFSISSYQAALRGRFGIMIDEVDRQWYSVELPESQPIGVGTEAETGPPKSVKVKDQFAFTPKLAKPQGQFHLKNGPDGMAVDPATGNIQWVPTIASLGNWDVEIVDRTDAGEKPVLIFELSVEL